MKGDFSRNTFDPAKHFSRVLMQQGRVQLDADWNEQAGITLHYLRSLNVDLVGPHWGPRGAFKVTGAPAGDVFAIEPGHYYVNGVLCENATQLGYSKQAGFPFPDSIPATPPPNGTFLAYLDVWERHILWIDDASIREVALGGPDTATRSQVVWQAKLFDVSNAALTSVAAVEKFLLSEPHISRRIVPTLRARAKRDAAQTDLCAIPPESRYRGAENQLYRVEIHNVTRNSDGVITTATFKWSRDNGSVIFPVINVKPSVTDITVTLAHLGRDDISSLTEGDIVELVDDDYALQAVSEPLCQVKKIDRMELTVTLECTGTSKISIKRKHIALRRWDHKGEAKKNDGALEIIEANATPTKDLWLAIEDGIDIQFGDGGDYHTGDYWLIPARTATGDVEWPVERDSDDNPKRDASGNVNPLPLNVNPLPLEPAGVKHYYTPLAIITVAATGTAVTLVCRREINQLWTPAS